MDLSWLSVADANTRWVLTGASLLGLSSGVLGSFALLRRRSLMGDALAHAALPGVCIAFLLTGTKNLGLFLVGAAVAGLLGTMAISAITRYSKIKEDSALGLVLTVFFGIGIMLLTVIQRMPGGNQSGLDKFLFGQAAALVGSDVQLMTAIAAGLCLAVFLLFKEFKLLAFDPGFGAGLGLPMGILDLLLNLLILLAVVIGLQSVGVVLMAAMLITPAVAARYWTDRLATMTVLAGLFGAASGALGTLLSQLGPRMPTGPLIVLAATMVFLVSLFFAPRRGLVARLVRFLRLKRQVARETALRAVYELAEGAGDPGAAIGLEELRRRRGITGGGALEALARAGALSPAAPGAWRLTAAGLAEAHRLVREQRLWEVFLMHEGELGGAAVDRDGALVPAALRADLERLLRLHGLEPALSPRSATHTARGEGA
ncbi:MAG: manganese transporter permease [Symbiobacteriaceae bacterium]|jgi:manganese/zinc/iron transport system permease protein|nr:manganese transporter permease [Symbiobacteriaceae bacterium]